ncbi:DUF6397 family protein [Streptomyces sp. NPDC058657]|uniref:DUF6397 family protein n=1 Tax=unclassified Streptomyces TaxID=2593676 RepID=UPI003663B0DE
MAVKETPQAVVKEARQVVVKEARQAHGTVTAVRAAQELGLDRSEFGLAVQLGRIRTVPDCGGGRRRVTCEEIDRLKELEKGATPLKVRLRTAGTTEAAALMGIGAFRFTALARTGYLSPARFYLNRYRAVVWLYLAEELSDFKARHPELLTGKYPDAMRTSLDAGADLRPRNWRSRRLGQLLSRTDDPWEQAAIFSSLLAPEELAKVVRDPSETAHLAGLRSGLTMAEPTGVAAREVARRLFVAQDRDEIEWVGAGLTLSLQEARAHRPLPGPAGAPPPGENLGPRASAGLARASGVPSWWCRGIGRTVLRSCGDLGRTVRRSCRGRRGRGSGVAAGAGRG